MDTTFQNRKRAKLLTDLDYQRMGLPTPAEKLAKVQGDRINRIIDIMSKTGMFDTGEFATYQGISGETDEFTVAGNWNNQTVCEFVGPIANGWEGFRYWHCGPHPRGNARHNSYPRRTRTINDWPARIAKRLEQLGVNIVWSDEYASCDCGKGFRTQPDSYSWQMDAWIGDGDYMCGGCYEDTRCTECRQPFAGNCNGMCHQWAEDMNGPCCHCGCED